MSSRFLVRFSRYGHGVREQSGQFDIQADSFSAAVSIAGHMRYAMGRSDPDNEYEVAEIRHDGYGGEWGNVRDSWPSIDARRIAEAAAKAEGIAKAVTRR